MPQRTRRYPGGDRSIELRRSGGPGTSRPARRVARRRKPVGAVTPSVDPRPTPPAVRPEPVVENVGAVRFVTVLVGMAVGMATIGLAFRLQVPFADSGLRPDFVPRTVVGAVLILLAFGVRVPQRLAWWMCVHAWQRFLLLGRSSRVSRRCLFGFRSCPRSMTLCPGDHAWTTCETSMSAICWVVKRYRRIRRCLAQL